MNRDTIDSVIRSLRRVNLQGSFFGQTVAIRFGLSESDVEAIEVLLDTGAATAGRLSELMGLVVRRRHARHRPTRAGGLRPACPRPGRSPAGRRRARPGEDGRGRGDDGPLRREERHRDRALLGRRAGGDQRLPDPDGRHHARRGERHARRSRTATPAGRRNSRPRSAAWSSARLVFKSGANEFLLRGSADFDDLYRAKFDGPVPQVRLRDGVVSIQYKGRSSGTGASGAPTSPLNAGVPWDVEIVGGSNKLQGKLACSRPSIVRADRRGRASSA